MLGLFAATVLAQACKAGLQTLTGDLGTINGNIFKECVVPMLLDACKIVMLDCIAMLDARWQCLMPA